MHSFDRTMLASLGFADPDKGDPTHDLACQYLAIPEVQLRVGQRFSRERLYCHAEREEYFSHLKANTDPSLSLTKVRKEVMRAAINGAHPVLEYVISKGEGKYKTTVGFIDLRLMYAKKIERAFSREEKEETFTFTEDDFFEAHAKAATELGMHYQDFLVAAKAAPYYASSSASERERTLSDNRWTASKALEVHQARRRVTRDYVSRDWSWFTLNVEVKANPVPIGNIIRQVKLYAEYVEGKWLVATTYPLAASDVSALNSCNIGHVTLGERFRSWAAEQQAADAEGVQAVASTFTL